MKKIAFIFCICLIGVALVAPANSQPNTGTWDSRHGDFGAGTWTEKLWGGAEGAPGNEILAEGGCYVFEGAILETVELMSTHSGTTPFVEYLTFYGNGTLELFNTVSCPWHNELDTNPSFIAELGRTIVVTKKYLSGHDPTGEISFILTTIGEFPDYEGYKAEIIAYYRGTPTFDTSGNPGFMTDDLDFAIITITGPDAPETVDVPVDIKPGSCPNPVNVRSKGVLPVAILGTADFDVTTIDPDSIQLNGVNPIRWALEDVATPYEPFIGKLNAFDCNEDGADGYMDLTLKFDKQEIVNTFGEVEDRDVIILQLTGELEDGTLINGEDVIIVIIPKLTAVQMGN
jgi:hypothetical protein